MESPGAETNLSHGGDRLILEPLRKMGLAALLDSWQPLDETFPEIDHPQPVAREIA